MTPPLPPAPVTDSFAALSTGRRSAVPGETYHYVVTDRSFFSPGSYPTSFDVRDPSGTPVARTRRLADPDPKPFIHVPRPYAGLFVDGDLVLRYQLRPRTPVRLSAADGAIDAEFTLPAFLLRGTVRMGVLVGGREIGRLSVGRRAAYVPLVGADGETVAVVRPGWNGGRPGRARVGESAAIEFTEAASSWPGSVLTLVVPALERAVDVVLAGRD